jgi:hypothetical protein
MGDWEGPRTDLDAVAGRKIPSPCWDSNPDHSAPSIVTIRNELCRLPHNNDDDDDDDDDNNNNNNNSSSSNNKSETQHFP